MVEGPVEGVTYEEVMKAMNKMKLGKAAGPSEVNMEMIMLSVKFGIKKRSFVREYWMVKIGQRNEKLVLLFQSSKERGCYGLSSMHISKAAGARNEDSGESAGEQNLRIGSDR